MAKSILLQRKGAKHTAHYEKQYGPILIPALLHIVLFLLAHPNSTMSSQAQDLLIIAPCTGCFFTGLLSACSARPVPKYGEKTSKYGPWVKSALRPVPCARAQNVFCAHFPGKWAQN